jgi:hypothetical protein
MAIRKVRLKGLRGNYQNGYAEGEVVYRKYKKEWHIYVQASQNMYGLRYSRERITMAHNSIAYVEAHEDLQEALKKAGKPLSTINDKVNNPRLGLHDIEISYDDVKGVIKSHKILVKDPVNIKLHKEVIKERAEIYSKLDTFGVFLSNAGNKLTCLLSKRKK